MSIRRITIAAIALALALSTTLSGPAAADLVISSSDPSFNNSVTTSSFIPFRPDNPSQGVAFTVNQVSTLDSIVANLAFEIGDTIGVTAQLFELGMSEKDKFGTPSYEYTLLGTSSPISVTGNDNFSEHTLSFSGQELDPGATYLIFLDTSLSSGEFVDWDYTTAPSSDFATPYGSIVSGIWEYTIASDQTSLVYNNAPTRTPELTINADVVTPEPSTSVLTATGLAAAALGALFRARRRAGADPGQGAEFLVGG